MLDEKAPGRIRPTKIQYRRLRAPQEDNQALQNPPLADAKRYFERNLQTIADSQRVSIGELSLHELSQLGRLEVFELARNHTQKYRDTSQIVGDDTNIDRMIMSGHQPRLFHPGVWFKNFALSALGTDLQSVPINLIVDNDICGMAAIQIPQIKGDDASTMMLPFDAAGDNIPFEARQIEDRQVFESFAERVEQAMNGIVEDPLVGTLWSSIENFNSQDTLGEALAQSRHAMELDLGLKTLEVPLSRVAQTKSFAHFAQHLVLRLDEFRSIYNQALLEYRKLHKIRSRSHPVPPLECAEDWCETPFWIWDTEQPIRSRLFAKSNRKSISLTDRRNLQVTLEADNFVEQFCELTARGIAVRPRALATTMFSRLVLSDLFLHGIGGAKYDQLNDVIIEEFFGVAPPSFMTLTATKLLPTSYDHVSSADVTRIDRFLRELTFHPETQISNPDNDVAEITARKLEWIRQNPPRGNRLQRHLAIEKCNQLLQKYVQPQRQQYQLQREEFTTKTHTSQIMGSREFSFCLFPIELADQLRKLAR